MLPGVNSIFFICYDKMLVMIIFYTRETATDQKRIKPVSRSTRSVPEQLQRVHLSIPNYFWNLLKASKLSVLVYERTIHVSRNVSTYFERIVHKIVPQVVFYVKIFYTVCLII